MRNMVHDEVEILLEQHPLLATYESDGGLKVSGKYKICIQLAEEVFEDHFSLEIFVPADFPKDIPTIKSTDGKIRTNNYKGHVYKNGQFCLEIDTAIVAFLHDNPSLLSFLMKYLDPFLVGFLYYQKHKLLPFGERKHGAIGLLEYYCELFDTADIEAAFSMLNFLLKDNLKGHIQCPCQSGKRYRNCHREKINNLRSSRLYERYKSDYATIIAEMNKPR